MSRSAGHVAAERAAQLMARAMTDALAEATADYWRRRGKMFLDAMPRPGDFNGRATPEELEARAERCRLAAQACFQRASLEQRGQPIPDEVWDVLEERAS